MITIAPLVALLLGSAAASPTPAARAHDTKGFYLVASPHKSTSAKGATGLNLVDPYYQTNYLLRAQPDGASYSLFNLTSKGVLETISNAPYSITPAKFESNLDAATGSVFFLQGSGTKGLFSFNAVGFLAHAGDAEHWMQCIGPLEQDVINYNGTDATCTRVYIFHQATPPASA